MFETPWLKIHGRTHLDRDLIFSLSLNPDVTVFVFLRALCAHYKAKPERPTKATILHECLGYGSACLSQFQNLVQLDLKVYAWTWHMLQALLQNAPNLEVLFVTHKGLEAVIEKGI
ncbi:hypothetical protein CFP56_025620 [Quercus suber]|uniref:Uncharacterized protein n=1 Tax=Quercus suber TaxID=58331 RepID=A0AAW0K2J1_QUESU